MNDQSLLYTLILIDASLGIVIGSLLIFLFTFLRRYQVLKTESENLKSAMDKDVQALSKKAVDEGRIKAQEIIKQAQLFTNEEKLALQKSLEESVSKYISEYKSVIEDAEKKALASISELPKNAAKEIAENIRSFQVEIRAQTIKIEKETLDLFNAEKARLDKEIAEYKRARIEQIDKQSFEILKKMGEKFLQRVITPEEHEKLAFKALQEAKKQGLV